MSVDRDAMRHYELARDQIAAQMASLEKMLPPAQRATVSGARERLERSHFILAVLGEFSSGKSFLLNALLGTFRYETPSGAASGPGAAVVGLLATDINPSTATITEIEWGRPPEAHAYYSDGRTERIPLDHLGTFVAVGKDETGKKHDATRDATDGPTRVRIKIDADFLQAGITVADTPGLASMNAAHRRATLQFLPNADAVLYLIDTQQPFSEGDGAFLEIIRRHIDSIFIVQTKTDLWEQPQGDGRKAWQGAHDRIARFAAVHAPDAHVFAVSARQYAEGSLQTSPALIERSRMPIFLDALEASLIATTGRGRLRRAAHQTELAVHAAIECLEQDDATLALEPVELALHQRDVQVTFEALGSELGAQQAAISSKRARQETRLEAQRSRLADDLVVALRQTLDTADIARLRDRAHLHALVEATVAEVLGAFAQTLGDSVIPDVQAAIAQAEAALPLEFSLLDAGATAFGAEPGIGMWANDLPAAISATVALRAVSGPAIALASDIASRFASAAPGTYMKRELTADLRAEIIPALRTEIARFAKDVEERVLSLYGSVAQSMTQNFEAKRTSELGSLQRAHALRAANADIAVARAEIAREITALRSACDAVTAVTDTAPWREARPDSPRRAQADVHGATAALDQSAYAAGLRPQRWRVAVIGALRRGKSSVINAMAQSPILTDDAPGELLYPVHVRYGPTQRAYVLGPDGDWSEIQSDTALQAASRAAVLIETPWQLPRELVLVHVPAFDGGQAHAEETTVFAASRASALLCLFSRQLSDHELDVYERLAQLGRPMYFAHTIGDNETSSERRQVVELARSYLAQRTIAAQRVFTVSSLDYAQARRESRAPSAWNEFEALTSTLVAEAETHMERLARLASISQHQGPSIGPQRTPPQGLRARLGRLLGRR